MKRSTGGIWFLACSMVMTALAGQDRKQEPAQQKKVESIENFGQVNSHIYRGGQPKGEDYRRLAALGIKTIVDLRGDRESDSRELTEGAGMRYINLPLTPKQYPQGDVANRFLEIVNDQENWPIYVHCSGGRHRTGVMIAVYRITVDGWNFERTYREMKDYDFYTKRGHSCFKDYVHDYYTNRQMRNQTNIAESDTTSNKEMHRNKLAGLVERPIKLVYKTRPIFR